MNLCYFNAVVNLLFYFCECLYYLCSAVVPLGVMIGMSGESWRHKSIIKSHSWFSRLGMPIVLLSIKFRLRPFQIIIFSV